MNLSRFSWVTLIYAFFVLTGGLIGFLKAGSYPSLIAGLLSFLALSGGVAAYRRQFKWGALAVFLTTAALTLFFSIRFFSSGKWMPAGLMFLISTLVLVLLFVLLPKKTPG